MAYFAIFHKSVNIRSKDTFIPIGEEVVVSFNYGTRYYLTLCFLRSAHGLENLEDITYKKVIKYKSPPITWYFLSNESFLAASSPPNYYQGVVDMGKKND